MYKLINSIHTGQPIAVIREDKVSFCFDPDNTDYQAYLKWVSEGNTPLPADE